MCCRGWGGDSTAPPFHIVCVSVHLCVCQVRRGVRQGEQTVRQTESCSHPSSVTLDTSLPLPECHCVICSPGSELLWTKGRSVKPPLGPQLAWVSLWSPPSLCHSLTPTPAGSSEESLANPVGAQVSSLLTPSTLQILWPSLPTQSHPGGGFSLTLWAQCSLSHLPWDRGAWLGSVDAMTHRPTG